MPRMIASWLSGIQPAETGEYPGERLGLPRTGPGSLVGFGRRLLALTLDWLVAYGLAGLGLAAGVVTPALLSPAVLLIWLLVGVVAVRLFGFTPGQFAGGLRVTTIGTAGQPGGLGVGVGRAAARGLLIALVIPALFADGDGRGLQDRATGTAVVRR
ncbi:MAG TPA: RDD family protein [Mycobacterium sp.]|nr:RDD family protein [Mycobacterium sp.]